jgi:DNA-binding NarL/FixJ family response regulator
VRVVIGEDEALLRDEGLRAALEIRRIAPATPLVVLSQHLQRQVAIELVSGQTAGVGYLLKQRIADVARFLADLDRVRAGGTVLDPDVVALMVARAEGRSNASIARALTVTERAVVQHVSNIYDQLGLPVSDDDHRRVLAVIRHLAG